MRTTLNEALATAEQGDWLIAWQIAQLDNGLRKNVTYEEWRAFAEQAIERRQREREINKTQTRKDETMQCCLQINQGRWCQESYETASRDAGRRARQLRKAGYQARSSSMGMQVTPLGLIKLTMVDIRPGAHEDTCDLPKEGWELVGWLR